MGSQVEGGSERAWRLLELGHPVERTASPEPLQLGLVHGVLQLDSVCAAISVLDLAVHRLRRQIVRRSAGCTQSLSFLVHSY